MQHGKQLATLPQSQHTLMGQFGGRFICLKLKFPNINKKGKTIGNLKLALVSVYHPCRDPEHGEFSEVYLTHYLPKHQKTDTP